MNARARRTLRQQIARLERELADAFVTAYPMGGLAAPGGTLRRAPAARPGRARARPRRADRAAARAPAPTIAACASARRRTALHSSGCCSSPAHTASPRVAPGRCWRAGLRRLAGATPAWPDRDADGLVGGQALLRLSVSRGSRRLRPARPVTPYRILSRDARHVADGQRARSSSCSIMFIGSLVLWIGTPLLWLWVGSQIQGATVIAGAALGAMFIGVIVTIAVLASLLAKLSNVYRANCRARGLDDPGPLRARGRARGERRLHARGVRPLVLPLRRHQPRADRDSDLDALGPAVGPAPRSPTRDQPWGTAFRRLRRARSAPSFRRPAPAQLVLRDRLQLDVRDRLQLDLRHLRLECGSTWRAASCIRASISAIASAHSSCSASIRRWRSVSAPIVFTSLMWFRPRNFRQRLRPQRRWLSSSSDTDQLFASQGQRRMISAAETCFVRNASLQFRTREPHLIRSLQGSQSLRRLWRRRGGLHHVAALSLQVESTPRAWTAVDIVHRGAATRD